MEKQVFFSKLSNHFSSTLVAGALILLPIAIVVGLLVWVFIKIEGFVQPALLPFLRQWTNIENPIPGSGVAVLLVVIYLFGLAWRKRIGRRIIRTFQRYMAQIPVIGSIYGPAHQP